MSTYPNAPAPTTAAPASPAVEQPSPVHRVEWVDGWEFHLLPPLWRGKP